MAFEPRFTITPHMVRCINAIERTVGFLQAVKLSGGDVLDRLREECRVQEALNSVQIEGNSLTLEQAFTLARDGDFDREMPDTDREFVNYLQAFDALDAFKNNRDLQLRATDLRSVHQMLVQGVRGGSRYAGTFRSEPVKVGNVVDGETIVYHEPPAPGDVPELIAELMEWLEVAKQKPKAGTREESDDTHWVHPAMVSAILHHRLVWIHPFVDGNGRTTRMFATLLLYQRGYDFKYLFEQSSYYNNKGDRTKYYRMLRTADRGGDYTEWLGYALGGLANQMYKVRVRAEKVLAASAP